MRQITITVTELQFQFLAGFFLGQCFSPSREQRKTAIKNYALLYEISSIEEREALHELQEQLEKMNEGDKLELADDLRKLIEKFSNL